MSPISWVIFLFAVYLVLTGGINDAVGLATKKGYQLTSKQQSTGGAPALPNRSGIGQIAAPGS